MRNYAWHIRWDYPPWERRGCNDNMSPFGREVFEFITSLSRVLYDPRTN